METKTCNACGHTFAPRPQNPNQTYCTDPACQRERRRRWQQQKRRNDADYRDNDARAGKAWAAVPITIVAPPNAMRSKRKCGPYLI